MKGNKTLLFLLWLWWLPSISLANDGFGGLTATGLQFGRTDQVRMVREDLFISTHNVEVRYLFHNNGPQPVEGEVIFPLPPISLNDLNNAGYALDEKQMRSPNPVNFTAKVNDLSIPVRTDRRAVIEPPYDQRKQAKDRYDTPGKDVTEILGEFGIPLSLDVEEVNAFLNGLDAPTQKRLKQLGLVELYAESAPTPLWSVILRYHWPQRFPAGKDMLIEHSYDPAPPGGIFTWPAQEKELAPYQQELIRDYCIDPATRQGIVKRLYPPGRGEMAGTGMAVFVDYVLTTANTWKGPIGTFHLSIDKGKTSNILSLCIDGIRKTGPTRFEVVRENFIPQNDLRLLIVSPLAE
ncbi:MAG: DUF4424 family protein [Desulfobulbus sp.]|nr:DUF4424 family protein [Desulfobulbus sp.]